MGGCASIQFSCDNVLSSVCNCVTRNSEYVHGLEKNLAALQRDVERIELIREDLLRKIAVKEREGLQRLAVVQGWISKVEGVVAPAKEVLKMRSVEFDRLCLCGYCSKNFASSYSYGKRVVEMVKEIEVLTSEAVFDVVAVRVLPTKEERPTRPMVGMEPMLESVWNRLMEDDIGILGLHGMGGVGKTTILSHISNRFSRVGSGYDVVIWVVVSKDLHIDKIQDEIWDKLLPDNEEREQKTASDKASRIYNILKRRKKFVLLLDDIWSKVDLVEIGVPFPSKENGCKIVFTTRLKEICGRMEVDSDMQVQCLAQDDAWALFAKKVGRVTLESHPEIPMLARTVAKKCRGLPLALNVIGETMAYKRTVQEWRLAIDILTSSAAEFSGMEDEILPILKYSYDNLKSEQLRQCFQYCALFPEDHNIDKNDLVDYWIGERIRDGIKDRAENRGYAIIGSLVRSCLLMEEDLETVKMHDVVREMALWVASDFGKERDKFVVQAGFQLSKLPEIDKWKTARRVSLMFNQIESIQDTPEAPQLVTLFLQNNRLKHISSVFFRNMPMLVILDLSGNAHLSHFPYEISACVSLQYLSLSRTRITHLPVGLLKLKKLIYLNLEYTRMVERIYGISGLTNLQVLRLFVSGFPEDPSVLAELQLLENLQALTITLGLASIVEQFLSSQRLASCTRVLRIENLDPQSSEISFVVTMDSLRELYLAHSDISEIKVKRKQTALPMHIPTTAFFPNLSCVSLEFCQGLQHLTWLLFAPNITVLQVMSAPELEEIISKERAEKQSLIPFQKLQELHLINARMLKYIHWTTLPFSLFAESLCQRVFKVETTTTQFHKCPKR